MATNRLPYGYAGKWPKKHSRREKKLLESAVDTVRKNTKDNFSSAPLIAASTGAAGSTSENAVNVIRTDAASYELTNKVGTCPIPTWTVLGLNIGACVDTNNDSVELTQGDTSRSRSAFTVGTDPAFYFEADIYITDVSGTDAFLVGFRKAEACQDNAVDDYDEMAAFNVSSGNIKFSTIINGATTVTTDSTDDWADLSAKTLRVEVARDGKVSYFVNGSTPTVLPAQFTFDAGEVVVPFISILADSDLPEATYLRQWNCGLKR